MEWKDHFGEREDPATTTERENTVRFFKLTPMVAIIVVTALFSLTGNALANGTVTVKNQVFSSSPFSVSGTDSESVATIKGAATKEGKLEIKAELPELQKELKQHGASKHHAPGLPHNPKRQGYHKEHGLWCKTAIAIWGASLNSKGEEVFIEKPGNHGKTHGCFVYNPHTHKYELRQILGPSWQWNCGNRIVWAHEQLPKEAVVFKGEFVIVNQFTYEVSLTVKVEVVKEGTGVAECETEDHLARASATVHGFGSAFAFVAIKASGSSVQEAKAKAEGGAKAKVESEKSEKTSLEASAEGKAKVSLEGVAKAECESKSPSCLELGICPTCHETHTCTCAEEGTCPPSQAITITGTTTLNMIPEGKNSGPFYVYLNASEAGGTLTVDPGIGSVSGCESSTQESSVTFEKIPAGNSKACIILYAPSDKDKPATMEVTFTAILGSAKDEEKQVFGIEYPTRP